MLRSAGGENFNWGENAVAPESNWGENAVAPQSKPSPKRAAVEKHDTSAELRKLDGMMDLLKTASRSSSRLLNQEGTNHRFEWIEKRMDVHDAQFSMAERKLVQRQEKQATSGSSGSGAEPMSVDELARHQFAAPEKIEAEIARADLPLCSACLAGRDVGDETRL